MGVNDNFNDIHFCKEAKRTYIQKYFPPVFPIFNVAINYLNLGNIFISKRKNFLLFKTRQPQKKMNFNIYFQMYYLLHFAYEVLFINRKKIVC